MTFRRDAALRDWRRARGEVELTRYQTQYNEAQAVIDAINNAPAVIAAK